MERIIDELWPDEPPKSARNSVQRFVADIRNALGDDRELLATTDDGYRLDIDPAHTDVGQAEQIRADAASATSPERRAELLSDVLTLIPDTIEAVGPTPSSTRVRQRWIEDRLALLEQRIEIDLELGRSAHVIGELVDATERNPYREHLWGQLMRALAQQGRQAEALRAFSRLRSRLVDDLGIDPSPSLRRIELAILTGDSGDQDVTVATPPVAAPPTPAPPAVPPPATSRARTQLIGRDSEFASLDGLLDIPGITSIVGPGGVGKTVLSTEAIRRADERATIVRLAEVTTDDAVLDLVVHALGIDTSAAKLRDLTGEIVEELRARPRPVLLDNAEHVMEGTTDAALLLVEHTDVPVIVTSREPLDVAGERIIRLRPLSTPSGDPDGTTHSEQAFVDKARRLGVELGDEHVDAVAEVCRRLDGLPLALELAAAQLAHLSVRDLAERLATSRDIVARRRGADQRHGSLRSLMEWSWSQLDDDERELLRRLAQFRSQIRLPMVELAGGSLLVLGGLVARSLIVTDEQDGEVRYSMLETVRWYVLDQTLDANDRERYAAIHAEAVLARIRQTPAAELARWSDTMRTIAPLRTEIATALDHLDAAMRIEDVLDATSRMAPLWAQLGPSPELQMRAARVEELTKNTSLTHEQHSQLLFIRVEAAFRRVDLEALLSAAEEFLVHERDVPTDLGVLARSFYGILAFAQSLDPRFEQIVVDAFNDAERTRPADLNRAGALQWLGCCQLARHDVAAAEQSFRTSLETTRRGGGILWSELGLPTTLILDGRIDEAAAAMSDVRTTSDDTAWAYVIGAVEAIVLARLDHVDEARHRLVEAMRESTGDHLFGRRDDLILTLGVVARIAGDHELADELLATACPANPILSPLLVAHLPRSMPSGDEWRRLWLAEVPTRNLNRQVIPPPDLDTLRRWAPGIEIS